MAATIKRHDMVYVAAGKDRGKRGTVERVIPASGRVVVQGVNIIKKHQRPQPGVRQGGIIEMPNPLHISNVRLICPHCDKAVRVSFGTLEDGRKVRRCKSCNETID